MSGCMRALLVGIPLAVQFAHPLMQHFARGPALEVLRVHTDPLDLFVELLRLRALCPFLGSLGVLHRRDLSVDAALAILDARDVEREDPCLRHRGPMPSVTRVP